MTPGVSPKTRKVTILVGALALMALAIGWDVQRRWGSELALEDWQGLDVYAFGAGDVAVFLLHGYGRSPAAVEPLARALERQVPGRYVLPRGPLRVGSGGWAWFEDEEQAGPRGHVHSVLEARGSLAAAVARARREGARRVVLMGQSMGGRMAGDVALSLERPVDGLVLLSSLSLPTWEVDHILGQRVFMWHGRRDPVFPFRVAEQLAGALTERGADVRLVPFDGGHETGPVVEPLSAFLREITGAAAPEAEEPEGGAQDATDHEDGPGAPGVPAGEVDQVPEGRR